MLRKSRIDKRLWALLEQAGGGERPLPLEWAGFGKVNKVKRETYDRGAFNACAHPEAAEAGYLLYLGRHEESHKIAQHLASREGNYWHAILHRMEPDDWNAMYWFGQAGEHPIALDLALGAEALGFPQDGKRNFDARRFVEFCSLAREGRDAARVELAQRVQLLEWQLLMAYCGQVKS